MRTTTLSTAVKILLPVAQCAPNAETQPRQRRDQRKLQLSTRFFETYPGIIDLRLSIKGP